MLWTVVLEKTLESPLDCKEIQPVHPKGVQSWVLIGRADVEAETPILWPPDGKSWLIWKDPDSGKDWRQQKKETTEDEMAGWHHQLNGHESEYTPELVMHREAWPAAVHEVAKSWTWLSDWTELILIYVYYHKNAKGAVSSKKTLSALQDSNPGLYLVYGTQVVGQVSFC